MSENRGLEIARKQIEFARDYTLTLLDGIDESDWFRMPEGSPTHLAWEVGHLAMAEYMLTLFRIRGKIDTDNELIPKPFLRRFVKGSKPEPDPEKHLSPAEIRGTFDNVHQQVMAELGDVSEEQLQDTVVEPYAVTNTQLGSLFFCASHEMLHAGQIGLLRRLLGHNPIR
ncbi:MAG: hypothetical protein CMJ78_16210 [Planctomycetaceae bacterium]|nr:hypothetical protein [Planctomycetaceae bacterium]